MVTGALGYPNAGPFSKEAKMSFKEELCAARTGSAQRQTNTANKAIIHDRSVTFDI
ncbi:MAG TPA: hypothetical protein VFK25_02450 [Candidatus Binatia bacterium]|nr:hypothetical protein [Candidatus Binatia bacterium]